MSDLIARVVVLTLMMFVAMGSMAALPAEAEAIAPDWVERTEMPMGLTDFAYCKLNDGRVFITGGWNDSEVKSVNDTYIFDPSNGSWTKMAPAPYRTYGAAAVAMPDGKVYVFGGHDLHTNQHRQNARIFDPSTNSWTIGLSLTGNNQWGTTAIAMNETRILVAGGYDTISGLPTGQCFIYDTLADSFTNTGDLPSPMFAGALVSSDNYLFYIGGIDSSMSALSSVLVYYPDSGYWSNHGQLPFAVCGHRALHAQDGVVYIAGGGSNMGWTSTNSNKVYLLSLWNMKVKEVPSLDIGVRYAGLVELDSGELFFFGGNEGWVSSSNGYALRIWSKNVWVDRSSVGTGETFRVYLDIDIYQHGPAYQSCSVYLVKDGVSYLSQYLSSYEGTVASLMITVPTDLQPGNYLLVMVNAYTSTPYGDGRFYFEPLSIQVTSAASTQEQLDSIREKLDALEEQNSALQQELDEAVADLKEANDAKLDAMIGYLILVLVSVTLLVSVVGVLRKR